VVHDAARPLATDALFEQVIAAVVAGAGAAIPGIAVSDSLRDVDGGVVDRGRVVAVQTPQAFRADLLRLAHRGDPDASDDATLVEMIGGKVEIVPGETTNFKITTSHDLKVARMLVAEEGAS
jgi:2-C-methyl-D-erythritol 4-phosphate cytidylyltransferase